MDRKLEVGRLDDGAGGSQYLPWSDMSMMSDSAPK